ncbi:MAG: hypothetical protein EBZ48_08130 [Proteobacteria bacterium]|nr:hypothetical protein [Pseudomonadota bacterium]
MNKEEQAALRQRVGTELIEAIEKIILPFYMSHGCPCAFPRFRALLEFDYRTFQVKATGCHESLTFVERYLLGGKACYTSPKNSLAQCRVCGSEFEATYEDYSISFYLFHVRCLKDLSRPIGAPMTKPFPLVFGLYGFEAEIYQVIDLFVPAGFDAAGIKRFVEYMTAM